MDGIRRCVHRVHSSFLQRDVNNIQLSSFYWATSLSDHSKLIRCNRRRNTAAVAAAAVAGASINQSRHIKGLSLPLESTCILIDRTWCAVTYQNSVIFSNKVGSNVHKLCFIQPVFIRHTVTFTSFTSVGPVIMSVCHTVPHSSSLKSPFSCLAEIKKKQKHNHKHRKMRKCAEGTKRK